MAVLQDNAGAGKQWHLFELGEAPVAPKGTFKTKVIDIRDEFGVERRKFDDPSQMEKVDLTAFLFGFRDRAGQPHRIDTRPMKISGNEKSNLFAFLKSLTGESPRMGWDYMELKGAECLITVEHVLSKDGLKTYAQIAAVSPLPDGFADVPPPQAPAAAPARSTAVAGRGAVRPAPRAAPIPTAVAVEAQPAADDPLPF